MDAENLLDGIPANLPEETFTTILRASALRIERIVSWGQCSPPGFWYDQEEHEWVMLLQGSTPWSSKAIPSRLNFTPRLVPEHPGPFQAPGGLDSPGSANRLAGRLLPKLNRGRPSGPAEWPMMIVPVSVITATTLSTEFNAQLQGIGPYNASQYAVSGSGTALNLNNKAPSR